MRFGRNAFTALIVCGSLHAPSAQAPLLNSGPLAVEDFVRVIDGDTLEVSHEGRRIGVGLIGLRAPQGNTSCGQRATQYLYTLVANGVWLEDDPAFAFDGRLRRMYRTYTRPGLLPIGLELAAAGFAVADGRGADKDAIAAAATSARVAQRGCVWEPSTVLNPIR